MELIIKASHFDILGKAQKVYARRLEPVCKKWALTRNELDILLFLRNNPQFNRAADIVSHRGIAKSLVSLSVASLESRGLLERRFAPSDRRAAHLHLTQSGRTIAEEGRQVQQQYYTQLFQGVSPEEFDLWRRTAQKVCDNITILENDPENP